MNSFFAGALAGLLATVPMTVTMRVLQERLPRRERYPLPPKLITMEIADRVGIKEELSEPGRNALTMLSHFDYGTAMGVLYGALEERVKAPPIAKGITFGLAVWAMSYLGWLPATGILPPLRERPPRRVALMIAAHIVWGASLGSLSRRFGRGR